VPTAAAPHTRTTPRFQPLPAVDRTSGVEAHLFSLAASGLLAPRTRLVLPALPLWCYRATPSTNTSAD